MGMARGETSGDRGAGGARGEPVAAVASLASTACDGHGEALRRCLARHTPDAVAAEELSRAASVRVLIEPAAIRLRLRPRELRASAA